MKQNKPFIVFLTAFIVIILDQASKYIFSSIPSIDIASWFKFTVTYNTGAGFGILQDQNSLLILFTIIIMGIIAYLYPTMDKEDKPLLISVGLIFGGAIGNLADRIIHGFVIDFINLSFWPSFNLADTALTIGAIILIIKYLKK
jgi:signal peptidase II